jgi:hypothetical protein
MYSSAELTAPQHLLPRLQKATRYYKVLTDGSVFPEKEAQYRAEKYSTVSIERNASAALVPGEMYAKQKRIKETEREIIITVISE